MPAFSESSHLSPMPAAAGSRPPTRGIVVGAGSRFYSRQRDCWWQHTMPTYFHEFILLCHGYVKLSNHLSPGVGMRLIIHLSCVWASKLIQFSLHPHVCRQMMRPQIQNDFASYRRHLPRMKREHEEGLLPQLPVVDTDANAISMFIAEVCATNFPSSDAESHLLSPDDLGLASLPLPAVEISGIISAPSVFRVGPRSFYWVRAILVYSTLTSSILNISLARHATCPCEQNVPFMVTLARATAETAREVPRVVNVIATVANMCCGMVQRRLYQ